MPQFWQLTPTSSARHSFEGSLIERVISVLGKFMDLYSIRSKQMPVSFVCGDLDRNARVVWRDELA